ncbi:MAG: hypothetical protein Q8K82_12010 [Gemmatimonadaceae bacterium]|nr:hypothetical protein [Gemmatimonadaceae bacterium]
MHRFSFLLPNDPRSLAGPGLKAAAPGAKTLFVHYQLPGVATSLDGPGASCALLGSGTATAD